LTTKEYLPNLVEHLGKLQKEAGAKPGPASKQQQN